MSEQKEVFELAKRLRKSIRDAKRDSESLRPMSEKSALYLMLGSALIGILLVASSIFWGVGASGIFTALAGGASVVIGKTFASKGLKDRALQERLAEHSEGCKTLLSELAVRHDESMERGQQSSTATIEFPS